MKRRGKHQPTDFSELMNELQNARNNPESNQIIQQEELPPPPVSQMRRRRSSLLDNRNMKYIISRSTGEIHDRDCEKAKLIEDVDFDMISDFPERGKFCEECYQRALIRESLPPRERKKLDAYCYFFRSAGVSNWALRSLVLLCRGKLDGIQPDYVNITVGENKWVLQRKENDCVLFAVEESVGQEGKIRTKDGRILRREIQASCHECISKICVYQRTVQSYVRAKYKKILKQRLNQTDNFQRIRRFSLLFLYYLYVDCTELQGAFGNYHGFSMKVYVCRRINDNCAVILCRIKRKDRKRFADAMQQMKRRSMDINCVGYINVCQTYLEPKWSWKAALEHLGGTASQEEPVLEKKDNVIQEEETMASNRILLINEEIQKELSALLRTVKDPRVQDVMISITRVETTPDLRYTKVSVSCLQEDKAADAMKGLKSAAGFLRRQLGQNLKLRYAPEIVWALDDSITYGAKMLKLINSLEVKHDDDEA